MQRIVDFYMENEWIRWILFIPLIFILNALLMIFVHVVNIGFTDSWIFQALFLPFIGAAVTITLTLALAPRWHSGFCWLWIALTSIALAAGIFNLAMQFEGSNYRDVVQAGVWIVSAVLAKRHMEK